MSTGWFLALSGAACVSTAFVWYWFGVGRTEDRFAADFDAVLAAYTESKRERDRLAAYINDLIDNVGVLTPAERDRFDAITSRLEHLR